MAYDSKLENRIQKVVASEGSYEVKHVFGGVAFMVNGNMACGVTGDRLLVRVGPENFESALSKPHVEVFKTGGRVANGWVTVAQEGVPGDDDLREWVLMGVNFARSLPSK